jgi:hypothetical protein
MSGHYQPADYEGHGLEAKAGGGEVPCHFRKVEDPLHPRLDRKLGYFGSERFVMFHYEPRGQEVIWNDGRSYGFGTGAWYFFIEKVLPLARQHGAAVGSNDADSRDALLLDRLRREIYFAEKQAAERFLAAQHGGPLQ